jgi:hypothetical protein
MSLRVLIYPDNRASRAARGRHTLLEALEAVKGTQILWRAKHELRATPIKAELDKL